MATLVLTVIGDDKAGLVNAVAQVVARHGGNWERSQMAELAGKFVGIVLVTVPDARRDALVTDLEPLHGMLDITAQAGEEQLEVSAAGAETFTLDLIGELLRRHARGRRKGGRVGCNAHQSEPRVLVEGVWDHVAQRERRRRRLVDRYQDPGIARPLVHAPLTLPRSAPRRRATRRCR